jgi:hypothetical protein
MQLTEEHKMENQHEMKQVTPEQYEQYKRLLEKEEKQKKKQRRIAAKQYLLAKKAKDQGIKVSEQEIDEYLTKLEAA